MTTVSLPGHDVAMPPSPAGSPLVVEGLAVAASNSDGETRTLVRDLSFRVDVGETLGLVGESGSGKSMTARAIVGLLPEGVRSSGSVVFGDTQIVGARERVLRRLRPTWPRRTRQRRPWSQTSWSTRQRRLQHRPCWGDR